MCDCQLYVPTCAVIGCLLLRVEVVGCCCVCGCVCGCVQCSASGAVRSNDSNGRVLAARREAAHLLLRFDIRREKTRQLTSGREALLCASLSVCVLLYVVCTYGVCAAMWH